MYVVKCFKAELVQVFTFFFFLVKGRGMNCCLTQWFVFWKASTRVPYLCKEVF